MLSIVIPCYNRRDCLLNLLRNVYDQRDSDFEVIVVDDCSPDDSVAAIRRQFPQVNLMVNTVNSGPCVTRNRGIRAAKGEIIVGFDSDVTVPDCLLFAKVEKYFATLPEATGFAFRLFAPDGVTDDTPRWWHPLPIETASNREFETDYFSGTAYAFRRDAVIAAGLFPEIYYMHYEEVELAWRILDQGGSIRYHPDLTATHHANPVSRRSEINIFYKPRNQILVAAACLPISTAIRYLTPRLVFQFLKACRGGHMQNFLRAMESACELLPLGLNKRQPLGRATLMRIDALRRNLSPKNKMSE